MSARIAKLAIVMCLFVSSLSAATDPFVGKWKLNQSKSKMTGEQAKVEDLGGNKFTITFGEISDTLVADGTDQPVHFGRTESITQNGPNTWKIVSKKDGRTLETDTWTLSPDGRSLSIAFSGTRPDGSTFNDHLAARRIAGTSGFAGTWETTSINIASPDEFDFQPFESDGLSFVTPAESDTLSMKFDDKDYSETGPNVAPGSVSSGHRVNEHTLEVTDKVQGQVMDTTQFKVSADGKTLTLTVHEKGQSKPLVFIYEKQ